MNREQIIEMARGAGIIHPERVFTNLERFFHMAQAAEREECANECEHTALRMGSEWMAHHCAAAIRARGQQ